MFPCTVHLLHPNALCLRCIKKFKATHTQHVQCRTPFGILSYCRLYLGNATAVPRMVDIYSISTIVSPCGVLSYRIDQYSCGSSRIGSFHLGAACLDAPRRPPPPLQASTAVCSTAVYTVAVTCTWACFYPLQSGLYPLQSGHAIYSHCICAPLRHTLPTVQHFYPVPLGCTSAHHTRLVLARHPAAQ